MRNLPLGKGLLTSLKSITALTSSLKSKTAFKSAN
jgi:hypothetical protein